MKFKYILPILALSLNSCDVDNSLPEITEDAIKENNVALNTNGVDFSNYVAVGASFTAGFTDGTLFKIAQENSFPKILSNKFSSNEFNQPLMNDNIGGLTFVGNVIQNPRLYFNGKVPTVLEASPTTEVLNKLEGKFHNYGIPGLKSFHLLAQGYGSLKLLAQGLANPYFARFASSETSSIIGDAVASKPTFFTLSEIGGNDVLGYALAGGDGVNQTGNYDLTTYGTSDITDPIVFQAVFKQVVNQLTKDNAKGVVANLPYITSLSHFTTVPFNPLDPKTNTELAAQIPTLNQVYGVLNQIYTALGENERIVTFDNEKANPVVIIDESLTDISALISQALIASGVAFENFVTGFGLPKQAAPKVAALLGNFYGQSRPATSSDLLVLPSSSVIGTINPESISYLIKQGLPKNLAAQFSVEGLTKPLADKWVLTPAEQSEIKIATDAYNKTIKTVAEEKGLAFVDFNTILEEASTTGIVFDEFILTTDLVTGGLISLDGVHLTARGYALMANKFLEAIDIKYGTNFREAQNGLAKAIEFPTNYSPQLR